MPVTERTETDENGVHFFKFDDDDEEHFEEELALAAMLKARVLFCNGRKYLEWDNSGPAGDTTVLFVNCNDLFVWGSADAEDLPSNEIGALYKAWMADKTWGVSKWCCHRRGWKPQKPIIKLMKEAGVWDDDMEALKDERD
jgi:hypothetical protein